MSIRPNLPGRNFVTLDVYDTRRPAPEPIQAVTVTARSDQHGGHQYGHPVNTMATAGDDFEKGADNGVHDALALAAPSSPPFASPQQITAVARGAATPATQWTWAAWITPCTAWPMRAAAWSGSGWPASSQAITASVVSTGSSRAAQSSHGPSG